jgi:hypothetical protein
MAFWEDSVKKKERIIAFLERKKHKENKKVPLSAIPTSKIVFWEVPVK